MFTRRRMLQASGFGIGSLALSYLLHQDGLTAAQAAGDAEPKDLSPRRGHFEPRARAMVHFMQNGGPGQMDLFDPKPELQKRGGQPIPESVEKYQKGNTDTLLASPFKFHHRGQCGMELSEALPHLGTIADEITLVRSMYTEHNNHTEALIMMGTGKIFPGPTFPWGLDQLCPWHREPKPAGIRRAPRPGRLQHDRQAGVDVRLVAGPVPGDRVQLPGHTGAEPAPGRPSAAGQRARLSRLPRPAQSRASAALPRRERAGGAIQNYELAARMQLKAGEVLDLSRESAATRKLYGLDNPVTAGYGTRCLMARRLIEAGVRFVQVFPPPFQPWDAHSDSKTENEKNLCHHRSTRDRVHPRPHEPGPA